MNWIPQRNGDDCSIASCAMALDITYEEAAVIGKPLLFDVDSEAHRTEVDDWLNKITTLAAKHGYGLRDCFPFVPSQGCRYIAGVAINDNTDPRKAHAIAVDEEGLAFDPMDENQKPWYDYSLRALLEVYKL